MNTQKLLRPDRGVNETFPAYCKRRFAGNEYVKSRRRGVVFWDSSRRGTYRREKER